MSSFTRLPDTASVIRVGPEKGPHFDMVLDKVIPEVFEGFFNLSSADKAQQPARLSVFDADRTCVDQAKAILSRVEAMAVVLSVIDIRSIDEQGLQKLDVVEDPLPSDHPKASCPGANGHCAILGMVQGTRTDRRRIRFALAAICSQAM